MPGELYRVYANKTAINEKRTAIKGTGFDEILYYWSSREDSSNYECIVNLYDGNIYIYNKDKGNYVLGFLALEV